MEHFKHATCNRVLNPARGTEDHVDPLCVRLGEHPCGAPMVTSFWRPSEVDLANLLA